MKTNFSIYQASLLLKRYFAENTYREIMFWSTITLIFTVLDQRDFVRLILYSSGIIFSVNLYKELWNTPNISHFFMIPATHAEKMSIAIFLNTFYFFGMTLLSYVFGHLLIMLVYHQLLKIDVPISWDLFEATKTIFVNGKTYISLENEFWEILGVFAFIQALTLVGSLYFKTNATIKTIMSLIIIGILLVLTQLIIMKLLLGNISFGDSLIYMNIAFNSPKIPTTILVILNIASYLLIPFLWIVSYFRLTEKQVQ